MRSAYFIGIGGIGISALARAFLADGWEVSGSDAASSEITDDLEREGVRVAIGNRVPKLKSGIELVVYSAAVPPSNPDLALASELGLKTMSYPEALGELTRRHVTIAVSGSHGKSTTTALLSLILIEDGLDPTVIVGTKLKEFNGTNFRKGGSKYLVIEADEWNRSFHNYQPQLAVVTNIDKEHLDTYKNYRGVVLGFKKYFENIPKGGSIVFNHKDSALRLLAMQLKTRGVKIIPFNRGKFTAHKLSIPGAHNQLNAEAAWQAAKFLGVSRSTAEKVFSKYQGAWRRMEKLTTKNLSGSAGQLKTAELYSDYAHHPTEIKATLAAFREKFPKKKIVCVFQPHQEDRLTRLFKEFVGAFKDADRLVFFPTYTVSGREVEDREMHRMTEGREPQRTGKDAFALAQEVRKRKKDTFYAESIPRIMKLIASDRSAGMVIVFMGAGDMDQKVRKFLAL